MAETRVPVPAQGAVNYAAGRCLAIQSGADKPAAAAPPMKALR